MSVATGADIAALCSKCGDVWHVVVAKVGENIVKVLCKECGSQHRYRHPTKVAVKKTSNVGKPPRERAVVERHEAPSVAADLSRAVRTYNINDKFEVADRLEHPTFGQGTVEVVDGNKITVFFAGGRKVLMHAKGEVPASSIPRPKPFDNSGPQAGKPVTSD